MSPSEQCLSLIKRAEGFRAKAYRDVAGVWTIGYGRTKNVKPGDCCAEESEAAWTKVEADRIAAEILARAKVPLTQGKLDALVSFAYNLGTGKLFNSTLWRKLNAGDYNGAAAEFPRWVHGGGQVLPGLVTRRESERGLFLS